MIAASIAFAFALYFSATVIVQSVSGIVHKLPTRVNAAAIIACLSWAAFYYFTHA